MRRHQHCRIIGLLVLFFTCTAPSPSNHQPASAASVLAMSGAIESFLNELPLPGPNTEAFVVPSDTDIASWRRAVDALLDKQYQTAATLADSLGYDLIEFTHESREQVYYVFRERLNAQARPLRGLGTYVYNSTACRRLSIQSPHPGHDQNTRPESIAMFLELNALALLIAGTHRCANSQASPCDGTTGVCGGTRGPYPISDVAHYTKNFFQPAHEEIANKVPGIVAVSVHGFGWTEGDPDLIISNGTRADLQQGLATRLATQYNKLFNQRTVPLRAGSCNETGGPDRLCGTTNVQGRFVNGSIDVCEQEVSTASEPERFIHLEQSCAMRHMTSCSRPASVPSQVTMEAFAAVFPCSPVKR